MKTTKHLVAFTKPEIDSLIRPLLSDGFSISYGPKLCYGLWRADAVRNIPESIPVHRPIRHLNGRTRHETASDMRGD